MFPDCFRRNRKPVCVRCALRNLHRCKIFGRVRCGFAQRCKQPCRDEYRDIVFLKTQQERCLRGVETSWQTSAVQERELFLCSRWRSTRQHITLSSVCGRTLACNVNMTSLWECFRWSFHAVVPSELRRHVCSPAAVANWATRPRTLTPTCEHFTQKSFVLSTGRGSVMCTSQENTCLPAPEQAPLVS